MSRVVRGPTGIDICPLCLFDVGLCYIGQGDQINTIHVRQDGSTEHSVREEMPQAVFDALTAYLASHPPACSHGDCAEEWETRLSDKWMDWNARLKALPAVPTDGSPDTYAKSRARGALIMGVIKSTLDGYGEGLV